MGGFFDGLIRWSITNRLVVFLGALAVVALGIWSGIHAATDALPDFTPPRVVIQTEASGMGTLDVESLVTRPIEQALLGTPQATNVRSTSSPGLSVVTMMFEDSVDIYRARQLVAERIGQIRDRLPPSAAEPRLAPISAPIGALLKFCITSSSPDQKAALRELRTFGDWVIAPRLLAVDGVAQITIHGGDVERLEVRPDPVRLFERGIRLEQIVETVAASQEMSGAGFVESGAARLDVQDDFRLPLDGAARRIESLPIEVRGGAPIRVGDIATVVTGEEPPVGAAAYDGRAAIYVQVTKFPWADTIASTRAVEAALHQLESELPAGATMQPPVFRQATFIETSVGSVARAMGLGAILVVVILIAFLRSPRLAAISLTAIPLSILAAIAVLYASGASINGMTLGGLAVAVGEVVDDAIVDVENVWRRMRENARLAQPRNVLDVIHDASNEVRSSVVFATLIVCLVLVPVMLMGGIAGRIFSPLALSYILSIAASLVVALTVTPAMCAWLLPSLDAREEKPTRLSAFLLARYTGILRLAVEHPARIVGGAALLALAALVALPFIGGRFLPEFHEGSFIGEVQAAPGTSLGETVRLATRMDAALRPDSAAHTTARIGRAELDEDAAPVHNVELDILLGEKLTGDVEDLAHEIAAKLSGIPGLTVAVEGFLGERVNEILSGDRAPIVVKVVGPDLGVLRQIAPDVARAMNDVGSFSFVRIEPQVDLPQLRIRPNEAALLPYGILPADLSRSIVTWRQGRRATQILTDGGRILEVVVVGAPLFRSRSALEQLPIGIVPLARLAILDDIPAPVAINHEQGERRISVSASAPSGSLSGAVSGLESKLAAVKLPRGYRFEISGEALARREAGHRLLLLGAMVLVAIFALLAVAFGSSRDAGIVLLNFPLGLVGGVIVAFLMPDGLSVAGFVGFVTLFGIIARNGIMLVAHTRHLEVERADLPAVERILLAAEERLLPILMTAATAGLGLLPLALSYGSAGSELESPMALIVCGGLVTSTALNMIVLPTIYVWLTRREARG